MFTTNTIKNLFVCTLNAICYAAYQAMSSDISICNNDEGRISWGMLHTAFNEVIDTAIDMHLFSDIIELYDQVIWFEDAEWYCAPEMCSDNVYGDICNALLYGMVQCGDNDIDVCGMIHGETYDDAAYDGKTHALDMLLTSYYYFLLQAAENETPVDEEALYWYGDLLLEDTKKHSSIAHVIDAWYLAKKAQITGSVDDAKNAEALFVELEQCIG